MTKLISIAAAIFTFQAHATSILEFSFFAERQGKTPCENVVKEVADRLAQERKVPIFDWSASENSYPNAQVCTGKVRYAADNLVPTYQIQIQGVGDCSSNLTGIRNVMETKLQAKSYGSTCWYDGAGQYALTILFVGSFNVRPVVEPMYFTNAEFAKFKVGDFMNALGATDVFYTGRYLFYFSPKTTNLYGYYDTRIFTSATKFQFADETECELQRSQLTQFIKSVGYGPVLGICSGRDLIFMVDTDSVPKRRVEFQDVPKIYASMQQCLDDATRVSDFYRDHMQFPSDLAVCTPASSYQMRLLKLK